MKRAVVLSWACALSLISGPSLAQSDNQAKSTVDIRLAGPAMEARTVNRSFITDSRLQWHDDAVTRLLMRLEVDTTRRDDAEGLKAGTVSATVWRIEASGKRAPLWSVKEPGDRGEINHDQPLFVVRQPGCCGARDSFTVFDLYAGHRLFTATANGPDHCWATLDIPNTSLIRLVALHAAYSATDEPAFGGRKETVGHLTYAAPDKPLARYRLVAHDGQSVDGFMGEAEVKLVAAGKTEESDALTLWSSDGKSDPGAIGGFAIVLHLSEGNTVTIP